MQRGSIITDLKALIGPGVETSDAQLATWVNDAYMVAVGEILKVNPDFFAKSALTNSIVNQQEYVLPADWNKILMVNLKRQGEWLRVLPMGNADVRYIPTAADTSTQGFSWAEPRYYLLGQKIGLMPIPDESTDKAIKIWYTYTPTALETDTQEPDIPKQYHYALKYWAYANYLDQDDEHVAAERMRNRFTDLVERMVENLANPQEDEPRRVERTDNHDLYTISRLNSL